MRPRRLLEPLPASHNRTLSCDFLSAHRIESPLRLKHRFGDSLIRPTPTEISAHALANALRIVARLTLLNETDCTHDLNLTRRANPTLQAIMSDKSLLHRMKAVRLRHAFNRE